MIFVLACCVAACFGVSVYLLLSREMKGVAMGVFLLSHGANLAILAVSGSPVIHGSGGEGYSIKRPPVSGYAFDEELRSGEVPAALDVMVDPAAPGPHPHRHRHRLRRHGADPHAAGGHQPGGGEHERGGARGDEDRRRRRRGRARAGTAGWGPLPDPRRAPTRREAEPVSDRWVVLPVLLPILIGVLSLPAVRNLRVCGNLVSAGLVVNLALSGWLLARVAGAPDAVSAVLSSQMGGWAAPFGISLVADATSAMLLTSTALVAFCGHLYAIAALPDAAQRRYFHPLFAFLIAGVNLSFLTGDLFNLFVAFEVMLMASYGLVVLGGGRIQLAQAYKYVLLNLLASTLFVTGAGLVYGMFGTLNVADLYRGFASTGFQAPPGFAAVSVTLLIVFALKAGAFPLWFWLPDVYPSLPTPTLAVFGGVLTKVGVYALARLFPALFGAGDAAGVIGPLLGLIAGATMLVPALMAVAYPRMRMLLCMMILTGVGFALAGVAVGTPDALAGTVFYCVQSMLVVSVGFLLLRPARSRRRHRPRPRGRWNPPGAPLVGRQPAGRRARARGPAAAVGLLREDPHRGGGALHRAGRARRGGAPDRGGVAAGGAAGLVGRVLRLPRGGDGGGRRRRIRRRRRPAACGWRRAVAIALLLTAAGWMSLLPEPMLALARKAGAGLARPTAYVRAVLPADPAVLDVAPVPPPKIGVKPEASYDGHADAYVEEAH